MSPWTNGALDGIAPPGQWLYDLAMVTGLALAMLIGLQLVLAFVARGRTGAARRIEGHRATAAWARSARRAHRLLGVVLLALVVVHPLFYLSAVTRRLGQLDPVRLWQAFTDGSFYADSLLIGLAGVLIVVVVAGAAALRRRVPPWHGLVRLGVLLGLWHALRIGSHVREGPALWLLWTGMGLIGMDAVGHGFRVIHRRVQCAHRAATQAPTSAVGPGDLRPLRPRR